MTNFVDMYKFQNKYLGIQAFRSISDGIHFWTTFIEFERSQAGSSDVFNLSFLVLYSLSQRLNFCEKNHHQGQMLVYPSAQSRFIGKSQSNVFNLHLEVFVFAQKPINFSTESVVLKLFQKLPFQKEITFLFSSR